MGIWCRPAHTRTMDIPQVLVDKLHLKLDLSCWFSLVIL
jgi:hypothetical protein